MSYTVHSTPGRTGVDMAAGGTAVTASDTFINNGLTYVYVYNGNAGSLTVTIPLASGATIDGLAPSNPTVTIPTLTGKLIGPLNTSYYNDNTGKTTFNYSVTASVTAYAFKTGG